MPRHLTAAVSIAAWAALAAMGAARAESIASSAASSASITASSASDSLHASSTSSTRTARVDDGEYRIVDVAAAPGRADRLRLAMQRDGDAAPAFWLELPQAAVAAEKLTRGDRLQATARPYGIAFARAAAREPFFLVLADDWHGQLDPRKL